jgi:hypothetical protein
VAGFFYDHRLCGVNRTDVSQRRLDLILGIIEVPFTFEDSGSLAVVYLATSAAPVRVSAPIVGSAAGASAQAAAFSLRQAVRASVGGPAPASAGASGAPVLASQRAYPALAGISYPALGFLCWKCSGVQWADGR